MILSSKLLEYGFTLNTRNDNFSNEERGGGRWDPKAAVQSITFSLKVSIITQRAAGLVTALPIHHHNTRTTSSQDPSREAGSITSIMPPRGNTQDCYSGGGIMSCKA